MNKDKLIKIHTHCMANREELSKVDSCGCFYCLRTYTPKEIKEWIEDKAGDTAICPYCDVDSVLPESYEYELSKELLQEMHDYWM